MAEYSVGNCTVKPMKKKILVVDDEIKIVKLVRTYLEGSGFDVVTASEGKEALAVFNSQPLDLIVLDLMLPEIDGLDVARGIRRKSDVPIIMLTARVEETDIIVGLELGADDYVVKPFSPRELVARVRAVLRRIEQSSRLKAGQGHDRIISVGKLLVDLSKRKVTLGGKRIRLTAMQFDLLVLLASQPGQVFTRRQILQAVQGVAFEGYERTIDAHIKNLRRMLGDGSHNPKLIHTIRGVGYAYAEPQTDTPE